MNSANVIVSAVLFYRLIGELGRLSMHSPVRSMYSSPTQKELMYPTTYHMTACCRLERAVSRYVVSCPDCTLSWGKGSVDSCVPGQQSQVWKSQ